MGEHLLEAIPSVAARDGTLLLYLTLSDQVDGEVSWKGCLRFHDGPVWEVDCYGGLPLPFDGHTDEVGSD
jgi:hypothetical protein